MMLKIDKLLIHRKLYHHRGPKPSSCIVCGEKLDHNEPSIMLHCWAKGPMYLHIVCASKLGTLLRLEAA